MKILGTIQVCDHLVLITKKYREFKDVHKAKPYIEVTFYKRLDFVEIELDA